MLKFTPKNKPTEFLLTQKPPNNQILEIKENYGDVLEILLIYGLGFLPFSAGGKQLGVLAHAGFALPFLLAESVLLSGLAGGRRR